MTQARVVGPTRPGYTPLRKYSRKRPPTSAPSTPLVQKKAPVRPTAVVPPQGACKAVTRRKRLSYKKTYAPAGSKIGNYLRLAAHMTSHIYTRWMRVRVRSFALFSLPALSLDRNYLREFGVCRQYHRFGTHAAHQLASKRSGRDVKLPCPFTDDNSDIDWSPTREQKAQQKWDRERDEAEEVLAAAFPATYVREQMARRDEDDPPAGGSGIRV